ncbi:MAG: glycosyltransferase [Deltaproteobacteria bacterium]|nr:MAG: glycosyltransferase [Deltaproteobacteria bacterium]
MNDSVPPLCSVIIRCCNEERHIGLLLDGLIQQTARGVEIIVVDSGSTDATLSIAARYPTRIISIPPEEFSFGRSLNLGCRQARGKFLVFASAHAYPVFKVWLERLLAPFADPNVAMVYGKQRGNEVTKYSEHRVFAKWFPDQSDPNQKHPFCNNANAAIRRKVWEKLPFDETLTGLEDIDWANRAMQSGQKIAYAADAVVAHVHNETLTGIYNRYRREAIALKRIFPQEKFNLKDFVYFFISNVLNDYFHAGHDGVLWNNLRSIAVFRLMQVWGTYRGFSQKGPVSSKLRQTFYYPNGWRLSSPGDLQEPSPTHRIDYNCQPMEGRVIENP